MNVLAAIATLSSIPLCVAAFAWYAKRARRTGTGQSLMTPFEEIWDPIAHRTTIEIQVESQRSPETPSPGDPPAPR
ncbi:hypothetical protein [Saccharothrix variisporea]|uniref:Secreted protein n=1 Tax=Saccharothrix variisporea TaxID=543527 RepID=A0A495X024_9PSEU|nr:hypothetical protein [Saccharothrix variisporea]RKT66906.1 hypothetical protein DFJ66_0071 [Saccharothrix variisporea]